jgi:hypothetical protein
MTSLGTKIVQAGLESGYGIIWHVVDFEKRSAIKSQVLSNFIAYWMKPSSYTEGPVIDTPWQVYYDIA